MPFDRVAILGLGLIGGSLARALAALPASPRVIGWDPDPGELAAARDAEALTEVATGRDEAVAEADLVVLAAPLGAVVELMDVVAAEAPPSAVVTDVASLKRPVVEAAARAGLAASWVGSHPMAGGERSGFAASSAGLFAGARVWTVASDEAGERRERVHRLWEAVGGAPLPIGAEDHDRLMAFVSHLPQLASNALAEVLREAGVRPGQLGPGGRDMTRLAASSPEMWRDLLRHPPEGLAGALRTLSEASRRLAVLVEEGDVEEIGRAMRRTAEWKRP